jgi:hypothetical protein
VLKYFSVDLHEFPETFIYSVKLLGERKVNKKFPKSLSF